MGKLSEFYFKKEEPDSTAQAEEVYRVFEGRAAKRSKAYKRHFEGFTETVEVDPKGNKRRIRVYEGTLYEPEMSAKKQVIYRIMYALLWAFAAFLETISAIQRVPANVEWYGAVINALIVAGLLWNAVGMINYVIAPKKRTVGEYRSSTGHLLKSTVISFGTFLLGMIINLICCFYFRFFVFEQIINIICLFAGAVVMFAWFMFEKNVVYKQSYNRGSWINNDN